MESLISRVKFKALSGLLLLLITMLPAGARADIYKCNKAGAIAYQETPCEGANVQTTHIEKRRSDYFVGCFAVAGSRFAQSIEVRANGAGTYQLIDERNPMAAGTALKQATHDELLAMSNGFHIKITEGLSRDTDQSAIYAARGGNRYALRPTPAPQVITAASLYGVYSGVNAVGKSITLLYNGSTPQIISKAACPTIN